MVPELEAACAVVWRDDGSTAWDDSEDLWFEGQMSGPTTAASQAAVYVETTGDGVPEYLLEAPAMPQVETGYGAPVYRYQGGSWVDTGMDGAWWRVNQAITGYDGYLAVFDWRALGLTRARFSFYVEQDDSNWTEVPEAFVGRMVTLPRAVAPSAPRNVTALAGDARARVRWARPAQPGTSPITRYTVTSVPGGRSCVTARLTCDVTGLRNGQAYRFRVRAQSVAGASPLSAPSAAVVPRPYVKIKISTRSSASKLRVDVDPNRGSGLLELHGPEAHSRRHLGQLRRAVQDEGQQGDPHRQPAEGHLPRRGGGQVRLPDDVLERGHAAQVA